MLKKSKLVSPLVGDEVLQVANLKCIFDENTPDAFTALNGINFTFKKNRVYAIIGDSGSGKSTLVTHFNGLLVPKYGNIWVRNIYVGDKRGKIKEFKKLRKTISMVFQFPEYQLFKDTVLKDIAFGPIALGSTKQKGYQLAEKYLKIMGLDQSYLEKSPFELSGGQKRRVAIAGILAIESEMIIFDEPTAGLDPDGEREMMNIILDAKKADKTLFVITHQMERVLEVADEILMLSKGKVLFHGTPYEIFTNQDLLSKTSIEPPPVIKVINQLASQNDKFKKLYETRPRTVEELAAHINDILGAN
ncbi:energy-coupling factor transporter ATPase [[Mycoplasma] testudinis]|uniref:energy-coupling factor transporter ATPase n=1 Tax=[Mycoplasma] testudinis TaxID=33924 RepID=UPI000483601A|nr:energy-coupling factor transporter ATPase [[Mycoplasma] testudinis]